MIEVKNKFDTGLDLDTSFYNVPPTSYVDARNITRNATAGSQDRVITNITGNQLVPFTFPAGTNKNIGSFAFQLRNKVYCFNYNSNGYHSITEFDLASRSITTILQSKTDSNGIDILNFDVNAKITSVNIFARDEGDLLFFIDSLGRPTGLDIAKFKARAYVPLTRDIIDKGKKPPLSPPSAVYDNDTTVQANELTNTLFRFKYRYIYDDYEKSTFSVISKVPLPVSILDPVFTNVITNNNVIRLVLNSGDINVKGIELAMSFKEPSTNVWSDFQSVRVFNKSGLGLNQTTSFNTVGTSTSVKTVFTGTAIPVGTVINIYLTQSGAQVLAGTYTTIAGDTVNSIAIALQTSMAVLGKVATSAYAGNALIYSFDNTVYSFNRVEIGYVTGNTSNFDFPVAFYNDSTYPTIDINESIELYDYIPDKANAQELINGNVLGFGGITEGYDKDTLKNDIVTVNTVAAGNGGVVGNLSAVANPITFQTLPFVAIAPETFSGIPATGTVINLKIRRRSDGVVITAGTYTTIAGDTVNSIVQGFTVSAPSASVYSRESGGVIRFSLDRGTYEALASSNDWTTMEIIPPSTALASNSVATWKWSSQRTIGRQYFDKRGKTNGVLYFDKVTFPPYAENGSFVPLLPFINYKIYDIPPSWAYSMIFVINKDNSQYKVWQSISVNKSETQYIYFDVTSFVINATKNPTTAQVDSYTFTAGDRVRIWRDVNTNTVLGYTYDSAVEGLVVDPTINSVAVKGTYLKIKNVAPFTAGLDATHNYVLEIYTPSQQTSNGDNQPFFEIGRQYYILDPTLPTRRHGGQVSDQVIGSTPAEYNFYEGDAYFRSRTIAVSDTGYATFNVMDKNFVDFYLSAVSSLDGRPTIIDLNARKQYFPATIRFSEAYQPNTNINGLNRFYEDNLQDCDYSYGDILRLKTRDRYLKVFQTFKIGVIPLYSQITKSPNENTTLIVSDKLLNPIQYRVGNFGLSNPESLASWHYADYGIDNHKGVIWRDSDDGVQPISQLNKVDSWAINELPLRTGNVKAYAAIDPKKNEYVLAMEAYNYQPPAVVINATGLTSILNSAFSIVSTGNYSVDWGDGTVDNFTAGTTHPTHTYTTSYTGQIKIIPVDFTTISSFIVSGTDILPLAGALSIASSQVAQLTSLTTLALNTPIFYDGVLSDLPTGLQSVSIQNTNVAGTLAQIPRGITSFNIQGANYISGSVSDLPSGLTAFILYGNNTIYGDTSAFPRGLITLLVHGSNTLSGTVSNLPPNLATLEILGNNSLTGDLQYFPSTLTYIVIYGNNTISGNIANFPTGLQTVTILGFNTITGAISGMKPAIVSFQITGNNTISGNVANVPTATTLFIVISALSTINQYTTGTKTWASIMNTVKLIAGSGVMPSSNVDNLLIELAAQATSWTGDKLVTIQGGSQHRTTASDSAVASLTAKGVTVITNP